MAIKTLYVVGKVMSWDRFTVDGAKLNFAATGMGENFLPVFSNREVALKAHPGAELMEIEIEVSDEAEVSGRTPGGSDPGVDDGPGALRADGLPGTDIPEGGHQG